MRKEPLTTIAVNKSSVEKLDEYCKTNNLTRKLFVEKAIDYFIKNDFDLNSSVSELTPLQNVVQDLKQATEGVNEQNKVFREMLLKIYEMQVNTQKALPSTTIKKRNSEYKDRYEKAKKQLEVIAMSQKVVRVGKVRSILKNFFDI